MRALRRWWWIPLAALLAILVKAFLVSGIVAGMATDGAAEALATAGLDSSVDVVEVSGVNGFGADGLNVVLAGPASQEQAAVAAVAAREEVDEVAYNVTSNDLAPADAPSTSTTALVTGDAAPQPVAVTMTAAAGSVVLEGVVPDEETRSALVEAATAEYGEGAVEDRLEIVADGYLVDGGLLTITGEAPSDDVKSSWVTSAATVAQAAGLGFDETVTVVAPDPADVEASLNDLFALEPIEFDVARATIRPDSTDTLDRAAGMINDNPDAGRLLVVGHTDGDGSAAANQALSEARAQAVVSYLVDTGGVDPARLEAEGRGESEPIAEPEVTEADKQRNRRITWELLS